MLEIHIEKRDSNAQIEIGGDMTNIILKSVGMNVANKLEGILVVYWNTHVMPAKRQHAQVLHLQEHHNQQEHEYRDYQASRKSWRHGHSAHCRVRPKPGSPGT